MNYSIQNPKAAAVRDIMGKFKAELVTMGEIQSKQSDVRNMLKKSLAEDTEQLKALREGRIIACSRSEEELQKSVDELPIEIARCSALIENASRDFKAETANAYKLIDKNLHKAYLAHFAEEEGDNYKSAIENWLTSMGFEPSKNDVRKYVIAVGKAGTLSATRLADASYGRDDVADSRKDFAFKAYSDLMLRTLMNEMSKANVLSKRKFAYVTDRMALKLQKKADAKVKADQALDNK